MPLYDPRHEKDNCGFGLIAHIDGQASHKVLRNAITGLSRMQHRGAILADGKTGDGCGLSLQMPQGFFRAIAAETGMDLAQQFAVGQIFLPDEPSAAAACRLIVEEELSAETLSVAAWRQVPVNPSVLGEIALAEMPQIWQVFINAPSGWGTADMQRRLFMARRRMEKRISDDAFYICSLSSRSIVYKGLCMPKDLPNFYPDLADLRMQTAICLFHQRFSTNTQPRWKLAQPFRYLAHNGEINTIAGNRAWARARAYKFRTPLIADLQAAAPFVNEDGSDSSALDNMLELFVCGGMDLLRAMRLLVPPAWQHHPDMDADLRAFYDFNSMHMEPWDGPAGIVFSDGRYAACQLDRNGLRPARYVLTQDRLMTIASEVGIWDYAPDEVLEKGRVGAGELLVIDTACGKILHSGQIDAELRRRHPYRQWMDKHVMRLHPCSHPDGAAPPSPCMDAETLAVYHKQFLYDREELEDLLRVMGEDGQEAVGSMGDDTPFAVLSRRHRLIYDYFRQYFAQVTNPPIDPLREAHVMSLNTSIGREMSVFFEAEGMSSRVSLASPVLLEGELQQLLRLPQEDYRHLRLDATYDPLDCDLHAALCRLCEQACEGVRAGAVLLLISDRGICRERQPIPMPLAVGALQSALSAAQLRCDANLIIETGEARTAHHIAVLIGLGATAVYPYLAYESLMHMTAAGAIDAPVQAVLENYRKAVNKGLYKIMSKMGIACVSSYRCAALFENVGLGEEVSALCFAGMKSRIGGVDFAQLQEQMSATRRNAWRSSLVLDGGGYLKYKPGGEYHAYNPEVVNYLQAAVKTGSYTLYQRYRDAVNQRPVMSLRDLLAFKAQTPLPLEQVEAEEELYPRFDSAAMSIGALSPEAHEALAVAMNRLGGFSNSGEGGEDPARYGTEKVSKIKQIASGRFGVTAAYLMSAQVVQIKIAQGAKPGEGGQLPGDKVTPYIAQLRYAVAGSTLISPPPHHDIYSIEDLAQLIFDIKQLNPRAVVSVKLVSLPGVGTIAAGVAKAYADLITLSGYDGGTGASPLSSVKYAGSPWELGLAEAQQALLQNGLRHKVRLQVDGGLKTGADVVKAAILGAESFGFGTGPMIALGCRYLRICHLNNCATGIATQDERLRGAHFHGDAERVMNYFRFIARDVRELLASLGLRRLRDAIGRLDLLQRLLGDTAAQRSVDLSALLDAVAVPEGSAPYCLQRNDPFDPGLLNQEILRQCRVALISGESLQWHGAISNQDRSVGAALCGEIARRYGNGGREGQCFDLHFSGTAGQSFGVWLVGGVHLNLTGDANDYVGKGMAGGRIVIKAPRGAAFAADEAVIAGNTCLYGATGGELFAAGRAGERFAVRNSGAVAVVEGIGDNGCEYMTGGTVVVLGSIGVNFGAGMTGGCAYVYDPEGKCRQRLNGELVEALDLADLELHRRSLHDLLQRHAELSGSCRAQALLADWDSAWPQFVLVKAKANDVHNLLPHSHPAAVQNACASV